MSKITNYIKMVTPLNLRIRFRQFNWWLRYYLQRIMTLSFGKENYCPVNEKHYSHFIKSGNKLISPSSGARERHRFIWHYLKNHTDLITSESPLLHISPEYCFYIKFLELKRQNYYPVDKFMPGYDYLSLTKDFDLLSSPNENTNKYKYIICNHVLEHINEDQVAINNLYEYLNSGGTAFVSVPILPNNQPTFEDSTITSVKDRIKYFGQWDHVRFYGMDISQRFNNAGFQVKSIESKDYFTEEEKNHFGVLNNEVLFVLSK